jgi:hypothetical protein
MSIGHHMSEDWNLQKLDGLEEIVGFEDGGIIDGIIY